MQYTVSEISKIVDGKLISQADTQALITHIIYDTRKISHETKAIFIAIRGPKNDGHKYIEDAISKGIKNIIVNKGNKVDSIVGINIIEVADTMIALQTFAKHHRSQYNYPVIGITGSNGKTTVKEWLYEALSSKIDTYKSPQSYNSQLGVSLSLLMMESHHEVAIIEAGISMGGEMKKLQNIIQPTIGLLTNMGDAHSHGFESKEKKLEEKLLLFKSCKTIIYNNDDHLINERIIKYNNKELVSWGHQNDSSVRILSTNKKDSNTDIALLYQGDKLKFCIPFLQKELLANSMSVVTYLLLTGWSENEIQEQINNLKNLSNRLEIKEGKNNSTLINDSYSADLSSVRLALEYQDQHTYEKQKIIFISALQDQSSPKEVYQELLNLIQEKNIAKVIAINFSEENKQLFQAKNICHFSSTEECMTSYPFSQLRDACILIKGATKYKLDSIYNHLSKQVHQTILETDYNAVVHNLNVYKSYLPEKTKIMTILKAEAYGTGSVALAQYLSDKGIDYLGVALIDEAITIREARIQLPIMIFNVQENNLDLLFRYKLEPEVYSFRLLELIIKESETRKETIGIHLKVDTGMHRLGFAESDIGKLIFLIQKSKYIQVISILSHLSASEEKSQDSFTEKQINLFDRLSKEISKEISNKPLLHILNTAGIIRHHHAAYDMVRLGIGLYGIDSSGLIQNKLQKVHSLKAKILQIKKLKKGESTGYNRSGVAKDDMTIAIISIGYADGLMRIAGNGRYSVSINNIACPTIGSICMDVSIIDVSHHPEVSEGDTAVIYGKNWPVEKLAESCNTISYEIISRIAPRVKRTYIYN